MDSAHRSSPSQAENPTSPVTGSALQSPLQLKANSNPLVSRAPSVRDEAVTRSPPRSADYQTPPPNETKVLVPRVSSIRDDAVSGSPVRSPSRSSEKQTASPKETRAIVPRALSTEDEAVSRSPVRSPRREAKEMNNSPVRSPLGEAERQTARAEARYEKDNSFSSVSSFRSPLHDAENPTASPQYKEKVLGSQMRGAMTVGSILGSPLGDVATDDPSLEKVTSPMVVVTNRMVTTEATSAAKVGGDGRGGRGSTRVELGTSGHPAMRKAAIGLRILALVLSMISFSVMAADKTSGWDGDSFDRYREFRYCLSVNVLAFVYSLFQVYVQVHRKIKKKQIMSRPVSHYFDFFIDQILAYLLMSASSSAASRNSDWVSEFGSDDFTRMINGSIAMSFLAFFALAFSSIISAYKFFSWNS